MSYKTQYQLTIDVDYQARTVACCHQQALTFKDDQRLSWKATADAILHGDGNVENAFVRLGAGGPGISDKVDNGDGTINSDNITDADLLSLVQANWPTVSDVFFNEDGTPV